MKKACSNRPVNEFKILRSLCAGGFIMEKAISKSGDGCPYSTMDQLKKI